MGTMEGKRKEKIRRYKERETKRDGASVATGNQPCRKHTHTPK